MRDIYRKESKAALDEEYPHRTWPYFLSIGGLVGMLVNTPFMILNGFNGYSRVSVFIFSVVPLAFCFTTLMIFRFHAYKVKSAKMEAVMDKWIMASPDPQWHWGHWRSNWTITPWWKFWRRFP